MSRVWIGQKMSSPLFVPNIRRRVWEEALVNYGIELTDWILDLIMEELGYVRPMIEIETMRRAIDNHIKQDHPKED